MLEGFKLSASATTTSRLSFTEVVREHHTPRRRIFAIRMSGRRGGAEVAAYGRPLRFKGADKETRGLRKCQVG